MMNTCHNQSVSINGYQVRDENHFFLARKEGVQLSFIAEGKNGELYFRVLSVNVTGRHYTAQRFLYKWIVTVRELAFHLADNNYLWDYTAQRPFLEVREEGKRRIDAQRIAAGKAPLYQ